MGFETERGHAHRGGESGAELTASHDRSALMRQRVLDRVQTDRLLGLPADEVTLTLLNRYAQEAGARGGSLTDPTMQSL